jgi:acyl-coenzyme A thioesterase PaaI-like protein
VACVANAQHLGRSTQVWDAVVSDEASGRTLALFRCTQMILWPK